MPAREGSSARGRYLITGGAGFVRASLVRALEARGDAVRVLDWGRVAGRVYLRGTAAEVIEADLADADAAARALEEVSAVVHLAARTSVPASIEDPIADMQQNVEATVRFLDRCRVAGVTRFVFSSSNAAIGLMEPPAREDTPPRPVAPYGASKLAVEGYLHAYHQSYGMATASLRFSNAYGPHSLHKISVVSAFLKRYLGGQPLQVYGDGGQTRDFVHVDDLVALVLAALDAPADSVAGQVFQAGTGRETTVRELAETILAVGGEPGRIEYLPARHGDVARNASDIGRARSVLGYAPQVALRDGIASTVAWFREALADPTLAPLATSRDRSGSD